MAKKNKKVVKFHKTSHLNIGIIIFLIIFIYMVYNIFVYFTTKQIAVYEVSQGTITQNHTFTGVILRDEKVFTIEKSGYINYYNKDASKLGVSNYVYSIDETGDFYKQIRAQNDGKLFSDRESYQKLEKTAANYVLDYSDEKFYQVYSFQYDMQAGLMEAINESTSTSLDKEQDNHSGLYTCQAEEPGIIVYNTDGLEGVTLENFTKDIFDQSAHVKQNLMAREQVNAGEPAFKLITNEIWDLVIPIEDEQLASELKKESNIKVKFKKDNSTAWGSSQILKQEDGIYLALNFQNSIVRFATDRYLEVELLVSDINGLKIPNTALTEKNFFVIPKEFLTKGGNNNSNGVMRRFKNEDGETITEFAPVTVAEETIDKYYITGNALMEGDMVLKTDSKDIYPLDEIVSLQGVYMANHGYSVFRKVEVLFQNEEYTIVDTGTSYGISLYDHIVLDASTTKENQIIR